MSVSITLFRQFYFSTRPLKLRLAKSFGLRLTHSVARTGQQEIFHHRQWVIML